MQPEATMCMEGGIQHTLQCCLHRSSISIHSTPWSAGLCQYCWVCGRWSAGPGHFLTLPESILQRAQEVQEMMASPPPGPSALLLRPASPTLRPLLKRPGQTIASQLAHSIPRYLQEPLTFISAELEALGILLIQKT